MESIVFIHSRLALTAIFYALAMGIWAAWSYFRGQGVNSNYWGALVIGEIVMIGQGVLGVILVVSGRMPGDIIHFLYGVLVALAWPGVYVYTHRAPAAAKPPFTRLSRSSFSAWPSARS